MKEHKFRGVDTVQIDVPVLGRRLSVADNQGKNKTLLLSALQDEYVKAGVSYRGIHGVKKSIWIRRNAKPVMFALIFLTFFFFFDSWLVSLHRKIVLRRSSIISKSVMPQVDVLSRGEWITESRQIRSPVRMYDRLLKMALDDLAENHTEEQRLNFWDESYREAPTWKPCAADSESKKIRENLEKNNGYILVSANGGLNQQRVAVCNAVAVAMLLNATLVLPKFLYSNVWRDPSQFNDIYQEEHFIKVLKDDINIVKELPHHLKASSIEIITDSDISKEAKPIEYIKKVLPVLLRDGVIHFLGFGNRLAFDPIPFHLQKTRCKCNFHALKFVPKIQEAASILIKRIRKYDAGQSTLDGQLLGTFMSNSRVEGSARAIVPPRYIALHLRFEVDMVAYSLCDFGGGENERRELKSYREEHFPLLVERLKRSAFVPPEILRSLGRCPLSPEEAALVLAALGFRRGTYIYLAGSSIYGGKSRMQPLYDLYPNLVTKEDLLTPSELEPFRNFSSQLAALDFIACATADIFAMTDSGSQLSSLVSGFRTYYGGVNAPTLKPSKKWLAAILSNSSTIRWNSFKNEVQNMIAEGWTMQVRRSGRSIYRQPKSPECMCMQSADTCHKLQYLDDIDSQTREDV